MNPALGTVPGDRCALTGHRMAGDVGELWTAAETALDRPGSTRTGRAPATIPPISNPTGETSDSATPSIGETPAVAPPANTSSRPGRLDRPRDRTRGHDDTKDGKK